MNATTNATSSTPQLDRRGFLQGAAAAALSAPAFIRMAGASQVAKIGIPLPTTSVQASVAADMRKCYDLVFEAARNQGIPVAAEYEDDKSDPKETARIISSFARNGSIVASSGIVGTPHAKAAIPLASDAGLPLIGIRSGADELRQRQPNVLHLRVSYNQELAEQLRMIAGSANFKLAVVYSDDDFGRASAAFVREEGARLGIPIMPPVAADRNGEDIEKATEKALSPKVGATALMVLMITKPMQKCVKHARENLSFAGPTFCMSFCATRQFVESNDKSLFGLGLVAAFPVPRRGQTEMSRAYNKLVVAAKEPGLQNSLTGFEAHFYGSVIAAGVARCGTNITRQTLAENVIRLQSVQALPISFDSQLVGFKYMAIVMKAEDGRLLA